MVRLRLGVVIAVVMVMAAVRAQADPIADDVTRGEELGRQGDWSRAIDAFKAADARAPRAKHACLIGLAYSRRELWAEAELFFALCEQRASPADPLPDWLPDAKQQLDAKLSASNASAITFRVEPPEADISVSSFAPGETFHSRTIHLAAGAHLVTVTAPGYDPRKQEVLVVANTPREVVIRLERTAPSSRAPLVVYGLAAALGATAIIYDVTAVRSARADLDTKYQYEYDARVGTYETRRNIDVALAGGAVVTAAVGVVLQLVLDRPPPVVIHTEVGHDGVSVSLGWSR
jgi:hypothetical protein